MVSDDGEFRSIGGEDGLVEHIEQAGVEMTDLTLKLFDEAGREISLPVCRSCLFYGSHFEYCHETNLELICTVGDNHLPKLAHQ
jgi:hypothetical protein